jgi:hypothetical protein
MGLKTEKLLTKKPLNYCGREGLSYHLIAGSLQHTDAALRAMPFYLRSLEALLRDYLA